MIWSPRLRNRGPEGLAPARRLAKEFHSRAPGRPWHAPWRGPAEVVAIGEGVKVYYSSDKRDPGDPDDPGGEWKGYFHDHDPGTFVHLVPAAAQAVLNGARPAGAHRPEWPDVMVWLGSADGYDVRVGGRVRKVRLDGEEGMVGLQLWAIPCRRWREDGYDLVAAPADGGREAECVVWCGPSLTVIHEGITG